MSNHKALQTFGRSGNPALSDATFSSEAQNVRPQDQDFGPMTLEGTVNKTGILLFLVILSASYTWNLFFRSGDASSVMPQWRFLAAFKRESRKAPGFGFVQISKTGNSS